MTFTKFRSRKLLLLLAFLRIDIDPYESQPWLSLSSNNEFEELKLLRIFDIPKLEASQLTAVPHNETVWIIDEQSNQCLNPHGFSECGDFSAWITIVTEENVIKLKQKESEEQDNLCLGWSWMSRKFSTMDCNITSASLFNRRSRNIYWSFDFYLGQLQSPTGLLETILPFSPYCVVNDNRKQLQRCNRAATKLRMVPLADISIIGDDTKENNYENVGDVRLNTLPAEFNFVLPDMGYWHCPTTGLALPRNLDAYEMVPPINRTEVGGRQVLMGAGVFTKIVFGMKFHIYTVGWYVEAAAAQQDPALHPFIGKSFHELQSSKEFYKALISPGLYDRTMFIKLAMNLKKDVVIQGVVEELPLQKKNANALLEASKLYPYKECLEGLEILFKWRQPNERNNFQERLDIVIGDFVLTIREPGLAQDFFYFYLVSDDPVSETARDDFPRNFPALLNGREYKPSNISEIDILYDNNSKSIPKHFSFTKFVAKYLGQDHREIRRMKRWKSYMNSLLLTKNKRQKEDFFFTLAVVLYSLVLIIMSLPPALLEKSVRVVNIVRKRSMQQLNAVLEKSFSRSKSLACLRRPSSLAAMARSASSEFKMFLDHNFNNMK